MTPEFVIEQLRASLPGVLPSLLMCDFGHLADEVARVEAAGVPALHLDVMDGEFVDNISYGFIVVETVRKLTKLPLETHLMIDRPERYVERFIKAGANLVTIHVEATKDAAAVLKQIRAQGAAAGLAFNPATPLTAIEPCLPFCDTVLVMSVNPGYGGQAFEPVALEKLRALREGKHPVPLLEIDGGIHEETIAAASAAGAQLYSVGSGIFRAKDYRAAIGNLKEKARASARQA
ncbi:MAG TPA: ribulose-phosphate 3-epimerase [Pirellulales bacterium]|jgi:ribulose-phosphate 3-epimerase